MEEQEGAAFAVMPAGLVLRGYHDEKSWTAWLSVIEYARASAANFSDLRRPEPTA
jgi:hypothetical protein